MNISTAISGTLVTLHVNTSTLYFDNADSCASVVDVDLYTYVIATPSHSHSLTKVFGQFQLAERSELLSSGRSAHGQRVKDVVANGVEEIALAIRVANQ